eukprot:CAMPEP_0178726158 /NCGR_PEP_ID=MMETSP0699-20121125/27100_1 /TAXON_ID=265572 /ORGANISM="Extubocellulus spinifer, Strain CCMP396" /LENGTH=57 /DNA_ID=CAMNT_0020377625 /DNA_START=304 /DNA_END=477 /DNA_ORIENTATION=-
MVRTEPLDGTVNASPGLVGEGAESIQGKRRLGGAGAGTGAGSEGRGGTKDRAACGCY